MVGCPCNPRPSENIKAIMGCMIQTHIFQQSEKSGTNHRSSEERLGILIYTVKGVQMKVKLRKRVTLLVQLLGIGI